MRTTSKSAYAGRVDSVALADVVRSDSVVTVGAAPPRNFTSTRPGAYAAPDGPIRAVDDMALSSAATRRVLAVLIGWGSPTRASRSTAGSPRPSTTVKPVETGFCARVRVTMAPSASAVTQTRARSRDIRVFYL